MVCSLSCEKVKKCVVIKKNKSNLLKCKQLFLQCWKKRITWCLSSLMPCPSMWPKQFWSDQIDMDLTIMIWLWPKWIGHNQNDLVGSKLVLLIYHSSNLDPTNSFWSWPIYFGRDQIIMVRSKSIWSDHNHFGPTKTVLVT